MRDLLSTYVPLRCGVASCYVKPVVFWEVSLIEGGFSSMNAIQQIAVDLRIYSLKKLPLQSFAN